MSSIAKIINDAFDELLYRIKDFKEKDDYGTFNEDTFKGYDDEIKDLGFWALYDAFDGEIDVFNFSNKGELGIYGIDT